MMMRGGIRKFMPSLAVLCCVFLLVTLTPTEVSAQDATGMKPAASIAGFKTPFQDDPRRVDQTKANDGKTAKEDTINTNGELDKAQAVTPGCCSGFWKCFKQFVKLRYGELYDEKVEKEDSYPATKGTACCLCVESFGCKMAYSGACGYVCGNLWDFIMTTSIWCFNTFGSVNDCCESFCFGYLKMIDPNFFKGIDSVTIPLNKYAYITGGNTDVISALNNIKLLHDGGTTKDGCFCLYWQLLTAACCSCQACATGCNTCKDNAICRGIWESCVSLPRAFMYIVCGPDSKATENCKPCLKRYESFAGGFMFCWTFGWCPDGIRQIFTTFCYGYVLQMIRDYCCCCCPQNCINCCFGENASFMAGYQMEYRDLPMVDGADRQNDSMSVTDASGNLVKLECKSLQQTVDYKNSNDGMVDELVDEKKIVLSDRYQICNSDDKNKCFTDWMFYDTQWVLCDDSKGVFIGTTDQKKSIFPIVMDCHHTYTDCVSTVNSKLDEKNLDEGNADRRVCLSSMDVCVEHIHICVKNGVWELTNGGCSFSQDWDTTQAKK